MGFGISSLRSAVRSARAPEAAPAFIRNGESVPDAAGRRAADIVRRATDGLPPLTADGTLPPGTHRATPDELVERFGFTDHRLALLGELASASQAYRGAGVGKIGINGSFATTKPHPNDIDAVLVDAPGAARLRSAQSLLTKGGNRVHAERIEHPVPLASIIPGLTPGENYAEFFAHGADGAQRGMALLELGPTTARELRAAVARRAAG